MIPQDKLLVLVLTFSDIGKDLIYSELTRVKGVDLR